ncbi:MAG TPA: SHOCT domain-containing protein [Candidatus Saccharimonadales bacterium]|nr:SHOCT domain-containing protein [Candidatus Saccharimonadales bacterium]
MRKPKEVNDMMWGYYDGRSWLWMAAMMLLFWGGIIALAMVVIRTLTAPRGGDQAADVLRRRLVAGEISQEEFEKIRKVLQG